MMKTRQLQRGMFLIEALIAILIFSLGVLGMMAMASVAVSAQSDAQYRTEASGIIDTIASEINLGVVRTGLPASAPGNLAASLAQYEHQATGAPASCNFSGAATTNPRVLALVNGAANAASGVAGLPGATTAQQQIEVSNAVGERNRVTISLCWQTPGDPVWRRHSYVTYVN